MGINRQTISLPSGRRLAALLLGLAASAAAAPVATLEARAGTTASSFELDGALQAVRQATVSAQVGGNLLALAVKAGDRVKAGQVIARIDDRDAAAGLLRGDAGVAQAAAELNNARLNAERTRELRRQNFLSQAALDVAETQLKAASAGLQQAQAGRSQAALARGFSTVAAPFDAVVLATHADAGDLAVPGRPIATVYAPGAMRAVLQVPASRAALARAATRVEVRLPDGRWIAPAATAVLPGADAVSQTVEWRLDLPAAASAGLMPGQTVQARFSAAAMADAPGAPGSASRLTLPSSAVLRRGELSAVYVVQGEQFQLRAVRTGAEGPQGVAVLAGLKAGERVAQDAVKAGLAGATPAP